METSIPAVVITSDNLWSSSALNSGSSFNQDPLGHSQFLCRCWSGILGYVYWFSRYLLVEGGKDGLRRIFHFIHELWQKSEHMDVRPPSALTHWRIRASPTHRCGFQGQRFHVAQSDAALSGTKMSMGFPSCTWDHWRWGVAWEDALALGPLLSFAARGRLAVWFWLCLQSLKE